MLHAVDQIDVGNIRPMQGDVQVQLHDVAAAEPQMQDQLTGPRRLMVSIGIYLQLVRALASHGTSSIALAYI
jgi:hypothetical protein